MKTILLSKTFWLQVLALVMLLFPPVKAWFDANPVDYLAALAALNVLLRFFTSGAVTILPAVAASGDDFPDDDEPSGKGGTIGGRLPGWVPLAGLVGLFAFTPPACTPTGSMPIHASYTQPGVSIGYDSKSGLAVEVDSHSAK